MGESLDILWASEQPCRHTGYGRVSRELAKRWVANGHEVNCMGWDYTGEAFEHVEGWKLIDAGLQGFGNYPTMGPGSPTILEKQLLKHKPDVFGSLIDIWYTGHMIQSANALGVPYVSYTPIDGIPFSEQWNHLALQTHTPLMMSDFGLDVFNQHVASGIEADPLLQRFIDDPVKRIYHGADLDMFSPGTKAQKEAIKEKWGFPWETVFLSVARNVNRKQTPRLLEALHHLIYAEGHTDVGLVIHCGDPFDTTKQGWNLPQLVSRYGLQNHVAFTDDNCNPLTGMSTPDLADLYKACDVHILSTGGEGFGIPTAEAFASGLPAILPGNSTGPELIGSSELGEGERGWLAGLDSKIVGAQWGVEMGLVSIKHLTDMMAEACDKKKRTQLGKQARKWAESNLDWDNIAVEFEELFKSRLNTPHPLGDAVNTDRLHSLGQHLSQQG